VTFSAVTVDCNMGRTRTSSRALQPSPRTVLRRGALAVMAPKKTTREKVAAQVVRGSTMAGSSAALARRAWPDIPQGTADKRLVRMRDGSWGGCLDDLDGLAAALGLTVSELIA
jgi:hypothetical protein